MVFRTVWMLFSHVDAIYMVTPPSNDLFMTEPFDLKSRWDKIRKIELDAERKRVEKSRKSVGSLSLHSFECNIVLNKWVLIPKMRTNKHIERSNELYHSRLNWLRYKNEESKRVHQWWKICRANKGPHSNDSVFLSQV